MVRLGLFERPLGPGNYKCPLHSEVNGTAFSMSRCNEVWLWKCHGACNSGGDEVTLIERHLGLPRWGAMRHYAALCGEEREETVTVQHEQPRAVNYPPDIRTGSQVELEAVSSQRRVDFWAVATMHQNGVLHFGTVCGHTCWIVTDASGKCAEARRLDGAPFSSVGKLAGRKAHTLPGSVKSWPVGLSLEDRLAASFQNILWVEGSGDLVAAYHFAALHGNWLPVAMLGASVKKLHPEAVRHLKGKRVRLVPHVDTAGKLAMENWGAALEEIGCSVDVFQLEGLRRLDGRPVKDLNDCTELDSRDLGEIEALLK